MSRIRRLLSVLRDEGVLSLVRRIARGVARRVRPEFLDECDLAYYALEANSRPGVMVDVGAHIGLALLPFARSGWRVVAAEPDSVNRSKLLDAVRGFPRVTVDTRAVSSERIEKISLYRSDVSTGISGLSAFDPSHVEAETVSAQTAADLLEQNSIAAVDFLKIDTEGYDFFVLQGFPFGSIKPRVIVCEFEDKKTLPLGYSWREMADFLVKRGYRVIVSEWHPIVRYGVGHDWRSFADYPCELKDAQGWGNLVAVRDTAVEQRLRGSLSRFRMYQPKRT